MTALDRKLRSAVRSSRRQALEIEVPRLVHSAQLAAAQLAAGDVASAAASVACASAACAAALGALRARGVVAGDRGRPW